MLVERVEALGGQEPRVRVDVVAWTNTRPRPWGRKDGVDYGGVVYLEPLELRPRARGEHCALPREQGEAAELGRREERLEHREERDVVVVIGAAVDRDFDGEKEGLVGEEGALDERSEGRDDDRVGLERVFFAAVAEELAMNVAYVRYIRVEGFLSKTLRVRSTHTLQQVLSLNRRVY